MNRKMVAVILITSLMLGINLITSTGSASVLNKKAEVSALVQRELVNVRQVKAKISALMKKPLATNKEIKDLLKISEQRLIAIESQLSSAQDVVQMEAALETASDDASRDTVAFVSKLTVLIREIDEIYRMASAINIVRSTLVKLRIRMDFGGLDRALNIILSRVKIVRAFHASGKLPEMMKEVYQIRNIALLELGRFAKDNSRYLMFYPLAAFLRQVETLRKKIQFDLPYLPQDILERAAPSKPEEEETLDILVCMMRWDTNDPVLSEDDLYEIMDESDVYYEENSYGRVRINFDFAGTGAVWNGNVPDGYTAEAVAAANSCGGIDGVKLADYDRIIVYPSITRTVGGVALTGLSSVTTDKGDVVRGGIILLAERDLENEVHRNFLRGTAIHEIGHFFGGNQKLRHANFYDCDDVSYDTEGCVIEEYGNPFDVMGRSGIGGHLGGWFKAIIGWVEMKEIEDNSSSAYRLYPLEEFANGTQLIRIPYAEHPLCIEYRMPKGYDDYLERADGYLQYGSSWGDYMEEMAAPEKGCLLINICDYDSTRQPLNRPQTALIDTNIDQSDDVEGQWGRTDACLEEGRVFENTKMGLKLSFSAASADFTGTPYAAVSVRIDEARELEGE